MKNQRLADQFPYTLKDCRLLGLFKNFTLIPWTVIYVKINNLSMFRLFLKIVFFL